MALKVYYEADVDAALVRSRSIAILGYGNQGRAHALNLRDAGCRVVVAQRPGSANHARACGDGFEPVSVSVAAAAADLMIFALPDEMAGSIFAADVAPHIRAGCALGFIHGFAIRFEHIVPPAGVDVILVAPKGPGALVRSAYEKGGGVACLFAAHQDASNHARALAMSWAGAIGGAKGGMMETTFADECETDLFGEQAVLCGGVIELMKAAYDVLIEAGYPEELAYFECIHEVKQIVDLQYAEGIAAMRSRISNTAAYGGLVIGPRVIGPSAKAEMRRVLAEIRSGQFARAWNAECTAGKSNFVAMKKEESLHPSENVGRRIRAMHRPSISDATSSGNS